MAAIDESDHRMRAVILAIAGVLVVALAVWVGLMLAPLAQSRADPPPPAPAEGSAPESQPQVADAQGAAAPIAAEPDAAWVDRVAAATGIPPRALRAYAAAHLVLGVEQPACGLSWNTLAGIGAIETGHGTHGGTRLGADGRPETPIRGPALDGNGNAAIGDSDGGAWDGDTQWDRAVGPMQFIPDTWVRWGVDADGDGQADPNQIDDAALAAARYLCASGAMTSVDGWRAAVFSYNHLDSYVDDVAATADRYAKASG